MKVLVIYFTRSGNTEQLAEVLAAALGADCERVCERDDQARRAGPLGYWRSLRDALKRRPATLLPTKHDVASYDLVAIGTPVWAGRPSTPIDTWLRQRADTLKRVAFFCSMGGRGSETTFDEMRKLCVKTPVATCAVTARDISRDDDRELMKAFARRIQGAIDTVDVARPVAS